MHSYAFRNSCSYSRPKYQCWYSAVASHSQVLEYSVSALFKGAQSYFWTFNIFLFTYKKFQGQIGDYLRVTITLTQWKIGDLKGYSEILWSEVHFSPHILILLHILKELSNTNLTSLNIPLKIATYSISKRYEQIGWNF